MGACTALLCTATCIATLSRAGWLALAVGIVAWLWLSQRRPLKLLLSTAAMVLMLLVILGREAALIRLTYFFVAPRRWAYWATAWRAKLEPTHLT